MSKADYDRDLPHGTWRASRSARTQSDARDLERDGFVTFHARVSKPVAKKILHFAIENDISRAEAIERLCLRGLLGELRDKLI